ncbi:2-dehydropantoate 2-reductase (EC [Olavius sp. associated proteobacterium Delta 1]|nr:2-dehydropantoate 2-reductase (EC [Olavius sp. associated proteobacterium Delta 1]
MVIAIIGSGAMGSLFGGRLKSAGNNVTLVDVWEDHIQTINNNGLIIENPTKRDVIYISACLPGDLQKPPDLMIIFTKTIHTESALKDVQSLISDQTTILTVQNGVGHDRIIARYFDRSKIIHGVTTYPCHILGPGHVRTEEEGTIKIMTLDGRHRQMLSDVDRLFNSAGLNCEITPDVTVAIWEKLAFNAALNGMTTVLRLPVGEIDRVDDGRDLVKKIVDEAVEVANRMDIAISKSRILSTVSMAFRAHKDHKPSMLQDVLSKRKTEVDFINGAIVREAKALGFSVPANETLYRLIKVLEATYLKKE